MGRYLLRRSMFLVLVLFVVSLITFLIFVKLPAADPARRAAGALRAAGNQSRRPEAAGTQQYRPRRRRQSPPRYHCLPRFILQQIWKDEDGRDVERTTFVHRVAVFCDAVPPRPWSRSTTGEYGRAPSTGRSWLAYYLTTSRVAANPG